jgi:hypothetical protein
MGISPCFALLLFIAIPVIALPTAAQQAAPPGTAVPADPIAVAAGVPLHIRVTRTAKLGLGTPIEGVLTDSVYVGDRLVLPAGAPVHGSVTAYAPVKRLSRTQALLNGDVTPLHDPVVDFTSLHLTQPDADIPLDSRALIRSTQLVRFTAVPKKPSLFQQGKAMVKERIAFARETVFGPNKKDRALRLLYGQLPYHPQRIWAGTQFIADLNAPALVSLPAAAPVAPTDNPSLNGITVTARLAENVDSLGARKGDAVTAIVTRPVFDPGHHLVLAQGAKLEGTVMQAKAARSFGRNGQLRFAFRGVKSTAQPERTVFGTLTGAAGDTSQNLTVDSEGNVKANPDKNRFVAPLLLAATSTLGHDDDHDHGGGDSNIGGSTIASNGFGLIARVIALTVGNANVASGFGAYALAKSITFRFLVRGHEVSFPKDTLVEVQLTQR